MTLDCSNSLLFSALKIVGVFAVLMPIVAYAVWVERKVSALIQDRLRTESRRAVRVCCNRSPTA